jgi:membrane protein
MKIARVLIDAAKGWNDDKAARMGAALAYYAAFALGPMFMIAISVAGLVFDRQAATQQIVTTLNDYIGESGARAIQETIASSARHSGGVFSTIMGAIVLVIAATGLFGELEEALNDIWRVKPKPGRGMWTWLRRRFVSFTCVLGTGFLLLVSLIMTAVLAAVSRFFSEALPGGAQLWQVINFAISFLVTGVLFALIFKVLPEVKLRWRDVWFGALVTTALFTLGKFLLALYIAKAKVGSSHGAAGSLVVVLFWVYYSSQILFYGAEITRTQMHYTEVTSHDPGPPLGAGAVHAHRESRVGG